MNVRFPKRASLPAATGRRTGQANFYNNSPVISNGTNFVETDRFPINLTAMVAADAVDANHWIAPRAVEILSIRTVYKAAGAGSSTVQPKKLTGTQDVASAGAALTTAAIPLDAALNTVITSTVTATGADLKLAAGDRIGLDFVGTVTGLIGFACTMEARFI